jgi:alkylation response protein AidB-like acyl-CoA dehydrogenase
MAQRARWNDDELDSFEAGLTSENLAAIMRSTWTWDDRALRRDLAGLLTSLRAVAELDSAGEVHGLVRRRTLQDASVFLAAVLGPRVIADSGHATSYSFAETLVRSPWLNGGTEDERLLRSLGATATAVTGDVASSTTLDLAASAYFATHGLAAHALSASGDRGVGAEYLSKIEAGALSATLAAAEASGSWDPALVRTRAGLEASGWVLDGEKLFVPHAGTADVLFVIARSTAGPSLFAVEAAARGLAVSDMPAIDPTRPLARVGLDHVPAVLLGVEGAGGRLMGHALDLASVALAEEQVGGIRRCLELIAAVVEDSDSAVADSTRICGELRVDLEVAAAMAAHAARATASDGGAQASIAAAMAHICCSAAFTRAARATAQLVGSDGGEEASEEAARLFRRAQSSQLIFGGPALYYERLLERMGI